MNPEQQPVQGAPSPVPGPTPVPPPPPQPQQRPPQPEIPPEPKYSMGTPTYDPNYLDSIAPQPPAPSFFSGSFGKIFFLMLGLFVLAVSIIVAFSNKDNTADLQQMVVRLENFERTVDTVHKNLTSGNLKEINSRYKLWLADARTKGQKLLDIGGIKKTDYNRDMVKSERAYSEELDSKFEDARLSVRLHRVYTTTMVLEIEKLLNVFQKLKKNPSPQIREYADEAIKNAEPIKKEFSEYVDDGN